MGNVLQKSRRDIDRGQRFVLIDLVHNIKTIGQEALEGKLYPPSLHCQGIKIVRTI